MPSRAFRWMSSVGVIESLFKELHLLNGIDQGAFWHPEGDVWEHTMLSLDAVPLELRDIDTMLAILCHDMGKVNTGEWMDESLGKKTFHGHAQAGVEHTENFLRRITDEIAILESVKSLVNYHMSPYELKDNLSKRLVRRLATKVDIPKLMKVHMADRGGRGKERAVEEKHWEYVSRFIKIYNEIRSEIPRIVEGRHLIEWGAMPEEHRMRVARVKEIYEAQLDGEFSNLEEAEVYVRGRYL